jgi:hypothetical protein
MIKCFDSICGLQIQHMFFRHFQIANGFDELHFFQENLNTFIVRILFNVKSHCLNI